MSLTEIINEVLEHYDYALVGVDINATDNKVSASSDWGNKASLFRYLTIYYGAERVSKYKGLIKIKENLQ